MLFGFETEFAFAARGCDGAPLRIDVGLPLLETSLQRSVKHVRRMEGDEGMFLTNGGVIYRDPGSGGAHLEYATPECVHPTDAVRHLLAGERLVTRAAADLPRLYPDRIAAAQVFAGAVDYGQPGTTWGAGHESYLVEHLDRMSVQMIPHLVSRILYTGAGGFDSRSPGITFLLSPRVAHIRCTVASDSTYERPIYHVRDEPLGSRGARMHLICGENPRSQLANWLRVGTTALVARAVDLGEAIGGTVAPIDPVAAMREFACDPACVARVRVTTGGWLGAIQIQRHTLGVVERLVGEGRMPDWAGDICAAWGDVLDRLSLEGVVGLSAMLDWPAKWVLYSEVVAEAGFTWDEIRRCNAAVERAFAMGGDGEDAGGMPDVDWPRPLLERWCEWEGRNPYLPGIDAPPGVERLAEFLDLRLRLFEIDTRFSELGPEGIFERMDRASVLNHGVPGIGDVDAAIHEPPRGSRAWIRGRFVADRGEAGVGGGASLRCSWVEIRDDATGRVMDLSNPFETEERWRAHEPPEHVWAVVRAGGGIVAMLERAEECHAAGRDEMALDIVGDLWPVIRSPEGRAVSGRLFRLTVSLHARRGAREQVDRALERYREVRSPMLEGGLVAARLCALRFLGVGPYPERRGWVERGRRALAENPLIGRVDRVEISMYAAYLEMREGRPEAVLAALDEAGGRDGIGDLPGRLRGLLLADAGEAARLLGRRDEAAALLGAARRVQAEGGLEDDLMQVTLPCMAKLETESGRPETALELLDEAASFLDCHWDIYGLARCVALLARIDPGREAMARAGYDSWTDLEEECPELLFCAPLQRIREHWDAWVGGGPDPAGGGDRFWGL